MKCFIVFSCLVAVALAKPGFLASPIAYSAILPGAPIGLDGRVVDTPEVAHAKAEHAAAHHIEKVNLANEAVKSADLVLAPGLPLSPSLHLVSYGSPLAADGRVVDTPEVAHAKAEHAVAHHNEKIIHANEAAKSHGYILSAPVLIH